MPDTPPKVFLVQGAQTRRSGRMPDLRTLGSYGEIHEIFPAIDMPSLNPVAAAAKAARRLAVFDEKRDYLAWIGGDPIALVIVGGWCHAYGVNARWLRGSRVLDANGQRTAEYEYRVTEVPVTFPDDEPVPA